MNIQASLLNCMNVYAYLFRCVYKLSIYSWKENHKAKMLTLKSQTCSTNILSNTLQVCQNAGLCAAWLLPTDLPLLVTSVHLDYFLLMFLYTYA